MIGNLCEFSQDCQIGGAFKVYDKTFQLCLIILIKTNFFQSFQNLASPIVDPMRATNECHNNIFIRSFIEHNLRMASNDDLRTNFSSSFRQQGIDLSLAQNFEMRIGLIKQQHAARVCVQMG